ncbi:MAG: putative endopeptidase [Bryobacterales bacterium]|jgi:endothelin-converting enzyme/putative endopeptidase|nr:putative endopeptidase [Bryobacterales bacterium]
MSCSSRLLALPVMAFSLLAQAPTGIDLGAIDRAASPCNDFYQYACGTWMKNNPIPADQSTWGRFAELIERNRETLRNVLEKAANDKAERSAPEQKIGDEYASCMSTKDLDAKGISPIQPSLDRIAKLSDKNALAAEVARENAEGMRPLFRLGSGQDAKDATKTIAQLAQGGLTLPDRDYYLKTDAKSVEIRAKYVAHIQKMFELAGHEPTRAAAEAQSVMALETALAKVSADRVTLRDPQKRYNPTTVTALAAMAPVFDWKTFLNEEGVTVDSLNVSVPDFVRGLNGVIAGTALPDIKTYLAWHVMKTSAPLLTTGIAKENFDFSERTLLGVQEQPPRWKTCVQLVDRQLGEALGQKYVEQAFGKAGKERTLQMVAEIEAQMAKDIQSLTWMSEATKKQSLAKLASVANKIGFPETWRDYSALNVVRGDLVGNSERASGFELRRELNKIGKPVDKAEWSMTPPTVNAYYSPAMNNINFPAGILQPPFYFRDGDEAANYGAIGAVVGHELTHGFDDSGRQYDGEGNLRDWWTADDAKSFKERADCLVNEYGGFVASGDVKLNGRLTLGENGADNGGVRLAYMALMDSLAKHTLSNMGDYTPEQRFFLAYGQVWCQNIRDQAARQRALTDPHSLGRYRVNGVLQNMPEFQKAFGCQAGQPMVSANSCRIW